VLQVGTATLTVIQDTQPACGTLSFSPEPGTYGAGQVLVVTTPTAPGEIRYTLDGTVPTATSTLYTGFITLPLGTTVVSARHFGGSCAPSQITTGTYTLSFGTVPTPVALPPPSTYDVGQVVTLTVGDPTAVVRYTLDGTDPTDGAVSVKWWKSSVASSSPAC
jgi:hypothetical protein